MFLIKSLIAIDFEILNCGWFLKMNISFHHEPLSQGKWKTERTLRKE